VGNRIIIEIEKKRKKQNKIIVKIGGQKENEW